MRGPCPEARGASDGHMVPFSCPCLASSPWFLLLGLGGGNCPSRPARSCPRGSHMHSPDIGNALRGQERPGALQLPRAWARPLSSCRAAERSWPRAGAGAAGSQRIARCGPGTGPPRRAACARNRELCPGHRLVLGDERAQVRPDRTRRRAGRTAPLRGTASGAPRAGLCLGRPTGRARGVPARYPRPVVLIRQQTR
jgi:hypothetical protein